MSTSGDGALRFSYCMLPDYPLADSIEMIKVGGRARLFRLLLGR